MICKTTNFIKKRITAILGIAFFFVYSTNSAQIGAPVRVGFTDICASSSFNSYTLSFSFTPASFTAGNQFVLEMSDASGSFTTTTAISVTSSSTATSPGSITFGVPTTTSGQNYRFRVKSTSPATTGPSSGSIPAYYRIFNNAFYINNQSPSAVYCSGGSFILSIDPSTVPDPSPVTFPSLKYKWFKNNVVIAGQIGTSLTVNSVGIYHVEIDYGSCSTSSSITRSQDVTVTQSVTGLSFPVTSSLSNPICQGTPTTLSTTSGYAYQWFKDNVAISGATTFQYTTDQSGVYYVNVNAGSCSAKSAEYTVVAIDFTASINVPASGFILPNETIAVEVTTNAINPTYQWFLNNSVIVGEITNTYTATAPGDYKVRITQNSTCVVDKDLLFKLEAGSIALTIPSLISPNGDGINDTWKIPQEYVGTSKTNIRIISERGEEVFKSDDYKNDWPQTPLDFKSINPVYYYIISKPGQGEKKGSITVIR